MAWVNDQRQLIIWAMVPRLSGWIRLISPDSLGLFYSAITGYLGFEVNEGEYKVMGLAPYGQPKYLKQIGQLIEAGPGGEYRLNLKYYSFLQEDRMFSEDLCELLGEPAAPLRIGD